MDNKIVLIGSLVFILGFCTFWVYDSLVYQDVCIDKREGKLLEAVEYNPPREFGLLDQTMYGVYWNDGERHSPFGGQYIGYSIEDKSNIIHVGNETYFYQEPKCLKYQKQTRSN